MQWMPPPPPAHSHRGPLRCDRAKWIRASASPSNIPSEEPTRPASRIRGRSVSLRYARITDPNLIGFYEAADLVGIDNFPNVTRTLRSFLARPAVARGLNIPQRIK